jgi:bifunctional non-homologous end joining protein LigD
MDPRGETTGGPAPLPQEFRPELASLADEAPAGERWLHELKYDGYRIGCRLENGRVRLLSRNGNDWTARFPALAEAVGRLAATQAFLDGEAAVLLPDGRTSFQALQSTLAGEPEGEAVYFAFDLLHLDGRDLSRLPLDERRRLLEALLAASPPGGPLRLSQAWTGHGPMVRKEACRLGFEGIVSKRRDLPYRAGRHGEWVKTKCLRRQELVIGGFTEPSSGGRGLGALLVGVPEPGGALQFAGKVGTGFTERSSRELRARLEKLERRQPPFSLRPEGWLGRHARWVRPELVAEVEFLEWTRDGRLRQPSFQGLREDKRAEEVVREEPLGHAAPPPEAEPAAPARRRATAAPLVADVAISHPDRVVYPEAGVTKIEIARYYEAIAPRLLPHLRGRPLSLVQCPDGVSGGCFFAKHSRLWRPEHLRRVEIRERSKVGEYFVAESLPALIELAQMNFLELHTWGSHLGQLERPDRLILDLDPGPQVAWREVIAAARLARSAFETLGLRSFVKNTGGVGLHVVVPLVPERGWAEVFGFARGLALLMAARRPDLYSTAMPKAGREGRILLDFWRNGRGHTAVAAFSTRARPRASVSVPLEWDELDAEIRSDAFTLRTLPKRLAGLRRDPWEEYWLIEQRISDRAMQALEAVR